MRAGTLNFQGLPYSRIKAILAFALLLACYAYMAPKVFAVMGADWSTTYVPAARALISGQNPYVFPLVYKPTFYNPVWALIPLIPLALLPRPISLILMCVITLDIYVFVGMKLKARPLAFAAFLLSPPVIFSLRQLNIDAFVLLGFIMPAPVGLFFVLAKPQIGIGMAAYWLFEAYRLGGVKRVITTFAPVTAAFIVTFVLYGAWFKGPDLIKMYWNYSIFPYGIIPGLGLLAFAIIKGRKYLAASAAPLLSPYVALYSWYIVLVGLFDNEWLMTGVVVAMWTALALIRR